MEWNEVKAKPKRKAKKTQEEDEGFQGTFAAQQIAHHKAGQGFEVNHQASAIANFDPVGDGDEEIKYETVSHECAQAVQAARLAKKLTQDQLAKLINEKAGVIHDIENGHGKYIPDQISRIEKALGVQIPRGRKNKKKKKKPAQC